MEYISQHYTLNTFLTPPGLRPTSPINSASSVNRGGHRDIEPLAQVMGSVLLSINNLSPTARLWQGVSLCLRSSAEQIGGVAQRAEGVAESLRSSETQLLSVCFHRKAVSDEWNISLNTILSTLNTFTTPPALRPTSPINSASSVNRGGHAALYGCDFYFGFLFVRDVGGLRKNMLFSRLDLFFSVLIAPEITFFINFAMCSGGAGA